jgi:hypothetical protein
MTTSRQQRRYQERQAFKETRRRGRTSNESRIVEQKIARFSLARVLSGLAAALSISISVYFYWPSIEVTALPWDNSTGPLEAKFEFRNAGRTTLKDVSFECVVNSVGSRNLRTGDNSSETSLAGNRGQAVGDMAAGAFVMRDCGGGGTVRAGTHPSNVTIEAKYTWPLVGHRSQVIRYFVSETDGTRTWMTPEPVPATP